MASQEPEVPIESTVYTRVSCPVIRPCASELELVMERFQISHEDALVKLRQEALPRGWAACRTQQGEVYYHCHGSGASQWRHPNDWVRQSELSAESMAKTWVNPLKGKEKVIKQPPVEHSIYDASSRHVELTTPGTLFSCKGAQVKREDVHHRAFALHGLITAEEATTYSSSAQAAGFHNDDVKREFPSHMRNNSRLIHFSNVLAAALWRRLAPHLMHKDIYLIQPMGFGAEGRWKPVGVNPCFRISRYCEGEHFDWHRDGMYVNDDGECSIYSLIIYLNDDFEGGELEFSENVLFKPLQGSGVLFPHDMLHTGHAVTSGTKLIARSDLMFRCVESGRLPAVPNFISDPLWQRMAALYEHVGDLVAAGDPRAITQAYQEALGIQIEHHGTDSVAKGTSKLPMPATSLSRALSFLRPIDVLASAAASVAWQDASKLGCCWRSLFQRRWPRSCEVLEDKHCGMDPEVKDWFGMYRRTHLLKANTPVCTIFLYSSLAAQLQGMEQSPSIVQAEAFQRVIGIGWDVALKHRKGWQVGVGKPWLENTEIHWDILPELVAWAFESCAIKPSEHRVLIPTLPGVWTASARSRITRILTNRFEVSKVHFAPAPLCALLAHKLSSGTVIWGCDVGECAIHCYQNFKEVAHAGPFNYHSDDPIKIVALLRQATEALHLDAEANCQVFSHLIFSAQATEKPMRRRAKDKKSDHAKPPWLNKDKVAALLQENDFLSTASLRNPIANDVLFGADAIAASPFWLQACEVSSEEACVWEWRQWLSDEKWHRLPPYAAAVLEGAFRTGQKDVVITLKMCQLYLIADLEAFTIAVGRQAQLFQDPSDFKILGPRCSLTRFLRGHPSSKPDLRMPQDLEDSLQKDPVEVDCVESTEALNIRTMAGKLLFSCEKTNVIDHTVNDLLLEISPGLCIPHHQLCLISGSKPLTSSDPLQPLLSEEGVIELLVVIEEESMESLDSHPLHYEYIPEEVPGEGTDAEIKRLQFLLQQEC